MSHHFDHDLDVLSSAAQRYLDRSATRKRHRDKIDAGRAAEAEQPERVQLRLERLSRAAAQEAVQAPLRAARRVQNPARLVESIGLERVIGKPNFQGLDFLELALAVSRFVCRVQVKSGPSALEGYGTGFMVSPSLLLTNNHVLPSAAAARHSLAEFDYQNDRFGSLLPVVAFELEPQRFFETRADLDFALVAVKPLSRTGVPLSIYAWTRLIGSQGKAILGDPLNIIQHPKGEVKQVVLRSNTLIDLLTHHAHYETDTEPGSSGSPVFNDQPR